MPSELSALVDVIASHVHEIQAAYNSRNIAFPSIDDPTAMSPGITASYLSYAAAMCFVALIELE
jgi:hypothetical protein